MAADAQLLGRITYEQFAPVWPRNEGHPVIVGAGKRLFDGNECAARQC